MKMGTGSREQRRELFLRAFMERTRHFAVNMTETWFEPAFPEDPAVAAWKSVDAQRTMRVQEADEANPIVFDWVIGKSGELDEFTDLLVEVRYCDQEIDLLFDIFRRWFIDQLDQAAMAVFLERLGHRQGTES